MRYFPLFLFALLFACQPNDDFTFTRNRVVVERNGVPWEGRVRSEKTNGKMNLSFGRLGENDQLDDHFSCIGVPQKIGRYALFQSQRDSLGNTVDSLVTASALIAAGDAVLAFYDIREGWVELVEFNDDKTKLYGTFEMTFEHRSGFDPGSRPGITQVIVLEDGEFEVRLD